MSDVRCVVCGGSEWQERWRRSPHPLQRCRRCGFVRAPLPPSFDLTALYGEDYNHGRGPDATALIPEARNPDASLVARREYWLAILEAEVGGPGRLLDIGCGAGALLDVASRLGWVGIGQEISPVAAEEARAHGHRVILGDLSDSGSSGGFDAATMIEVIEHIPDPRPTLTAARGLLRDGGALLLTTGDVGSTRARLRGSHWVYVRPPIHVSYFSRDTIERLLLACGFSRVAFPPTFNLAFPSLPLVGSSSSAVVTRAARAVRRLSRSEMCVLAMA